MSANFEAVMSLMCLTASENEIPGQAGKARAVQYQSKDGRLHIVYCRHHIETLI